MSAVARPRGTSERGAAVLFGFEGVRVLADPADPADASVRPGRGRRPRGRARPQRSPSVILDGIDTTVDATGVTCILGPSGAGKSTFLRLCNRLVVTDAGTVSFRGQRIDELDVLDLRRRVGMVFQRPTLFGGTVGDNLRVAVPDATDHELGSVLETAELPARFLDRQGGELSGGEAQRVCLARALANRPEVLLMDEPTSALDPAARGALERLARRLADDGVPILWVTHDLEQAGRIADDVRVMIAGRIAASGTMPAVAGLDDPAVRAFLAGDHDQGRASA